MTVKIQVEVTDEALMNIIVQELSDMYDMVDGRAGTKKERAVLENIIAIIKYYLAPRDFKKWKKEHLQ